jgi:hypothetical protein
MQTNRLKNIGIILATLTLLFLYTLFRSIVSSITFLNAFDIVSSNIITELWKFISTPTIFLGLLAFILIWRFRNSIESVFPGLKELKAGSFSALFETPILQDSDQSITELPNKKIDKNEANLEEKILDRTIDSLGKKFIQFFLDVDGKSFTPDEIVRKLAEYKPYETFLISENERVRIGYYGGVYRAVLGHVMRKIFIINVHEDKKGSNFNLKAGIREKLENRLNMLETKA